MTSPARTRRGPDPGPGGTGEPSGRRPADPPRGGPPRATTDGHVLRKTEPQPPAAAPPPPCGPAEVDARLAPLPVGALGLDAETVRLLDRLGLRTIGALAAVPRTALMRRFADRPPAANPLVLLDRATGRLPEPLDAPPDPRRFVVRARLAEPVMDAAPHLPGLCEDLCTALEAAGRGARLLRLTVYRVDGTWRSAEVATARASRDPAHVRRLLDGRLDRIDPGFGFDLLTLEALRTEPSVPRQEGLAGGADPNAGVDALLDRLTARLGPSRVMWSHWRESHLPERVEVPVPALGARPAAPPAIARERPLRLLDPAEEVRVLYAVPEGPPARFVWRRVRLEVARHEGPERVAPEWWRQRAGTRLRDYYKVEVTDGRRLWLYREGVLGDGRGRVITSGPEGANAVDMPRPAGVAAPEPDGGHGAAAAAPPQAVDQGRGCPGTTSRAGDVANPPSGRRGDAAPEMDGTDRAGRAGAPAAPDPDAAPPPPAPHSAADAAGSPAAPHRQDAVVPFHRPAYFPAPLSAPAILAGGAPGPREDAAKPEGRVLAFPGDGDGGGTGEAAPRPVEMPPRWFVHGLFA